MPNIEFAPDDKMDTRAYQIMEKAFGLDLTREIFISNGLRIEVFPILRKIETEGNEYLKKLFSVPEDDNPSRKKYLAMKSRIDAIRRVEKAFGVKLEELKDVDKHPSVTLQDVAKAVDDFELKRLQDLKNTNDS